MEINPQISIVEINENKFQQELKPLKGIDFDSKVQHFEQILFGGQNYKLNGTDPIENGTVQNAISKLGDVIFGKVEEFKISIDKKMQEINALLNSKNEVSMTDLLRAQWQVGMYAVETTLLANTGDKVSDGIQTLFRNQ
jgi:hypothetical protein